MIYWGSHYYCNSSYDGLCCSWCGIKYFSVIHSHWPVIELLLTKAAVVRPFIPIKKIFVSPSKTFKTKINVQKLRRHQNIL